MSVQLSKQIIIDKSVVDRIVITYERNSAGITYVQSTYDTSGNILERETKSIPKNVAVQFLLTQLPSPQFLFDQLDTWIISQTHEGTLAPNTDVNISA